MITLETKQPVYKSAIFSMVTFIAILMLSYFNGDQRRLYTLFYLVFPFIGLIVEVVKWRAKKKILQIEDHLITIGDISIEAAEIKTLHIRFSGVVGLKPHEKWIVPTRLRFQLVDKDHTDVLVAWAKKNGVKIRYGTFQTWY